MSFFLPSYFILFLFDLITIISVVFGLLFHFFVCIITSWEIDGETVETVSDFIFLGSKIPADGDSSHEIKRHLLLGRKVMTNLDSIFKSRDNYFANKGPSSQGYSFPVAMYGSESWTINKAEC